MEESSTPLILCMENSSGEDVALKIHPTDDFKTFLDKASTLLGFQVDINTITRNKVVDLTDNIYEFLMNAEKNKLSNTSSELNLNILEENAGGDSVYMLDDGTQIDASQIQFDNDEPDEKFNVNTLPFVKRSDVIDEVEENKISDAVETKVYNIESSPLRKPKYTNHKKSFASTLPFSILPNKAKNFEAQVSKFLIQRPANLAYNNTTPITHNIKINKETAPIKQVQEIVYTREQVLNLVKDAPLPNQVETIDNPNNEVRRNARKSDPCKPVQKKKDNFSSMFKEIPRQSNVNSQMCVICHKSLDRARDKLYLFDKEDQKHHRSLRQTKQSDHLKVICENCLKVNFKPGIIKDPKLTLEENEFLVIRNNQQLVFHRNIKEKDKIDPEIEVKTKADDDKDEVEFVNEVLATDSEIVNKENININKSVVVIKEEYQSDPEETNVHNLDDDEEPIEDFLGKYKEINLANAKCRFCLMSLPDINEVIQHGSKHNHDIANNGEIYPCPICDYGYGDCKWLKLHIRVAHDKNFDRNNFNLKINLDEGKLKEENLDNSDKSKEEVLDCIDDDSKGNVIVKNNVKEAKKSTSPVAKRTRSSRNKKSDSPVKESSDLIDSTPCEENNGDSKHTATDESKDEEVDVKNEITIKSEVQDKSDSESIWILEAEEHTDDELYNENNSLWSFENKLQNNKDKSKNAMEICISCEFCNQIVVSKESLKSHKCSKKRGRKRRSDDDVVYVPNENCDDKANKKKSTDYKRDSQVMTCHNCSESFTSKVRLKFHMQFHEDSCTYITESGYKCTDCKSNTVFSTENALFDHVHFDHPKLKRWQCPVKGCGKTFYLRATLTKHSRSHTDTRRYGCVSCGKRFFDKQTLDEHGVTHLKIKPYQCHICLKQLTRRSRLRMHLRAHEEELSPALVFVCRVCARAFKDHTEAEEHGTCYEECINTINLPSTKLSPITGLLIDLPENVKKVQAIKARHKIYEPTDQEKKNEMLNHLTKDAQLVINVVEIEKAFRCEYCEEVFFVEENLNNHRKLHRNVKNPFTCHICKVAFATYSRCTTHKTTHGFYKRPLYKNKTDSKENNVIGDLIPASGILGYGGFPVVKHFLCEDCGRSYLHWTYLQVHRRMKHPRNSLVHQCSTCRLTFPNSWSVSYHKKKVHGIGKKTKDKECWIPCRDCEEVLPNKSALYKHRSKKHCNLTDKGDETFCNTCGEDENPKTPHKCITKNKNKYYCLVCGHSFRTITQRNEHLRIHTGEKPFTCKECGVSFRRLSALRNHRLTHKEVPGEPTYFHLLLEIPGLNPSPERIMEELNNYQVKMGNIIDITKISFKKGEVLNVPDCTEELLKLLELKTEELSEWKKQLMIQFNLAKVINNIVGDKELNSTMADNNETDGGGTQPIQTNYPITLNIPGEEISDVNLQLLLREGVVVNGSQMVPLYPNFNPYFNEPINDIMNSGISIEILRDVDNCSVIDIE